MRSIDVEKLAQHRARSFCLHSDDRVKTPEEALQLVDRLGFLFFWPIRGIDLPSLWVAVADQRAVAEAHDDPGHATWSWKDDALGKRRWYYAKVLKRKATFISLAVVPTFYALSQNYGSPEEDHIIAYEEGRLTLAAKQVYDALLERGELDTITLRKEARLQNAKESVFNRALEDLQADFKILPVGIAEAGAWRYAYRYDLTSRHFPELLDQALAIGEAQARKELVTLYLKAIGAAQKRDVGRLFGWTPELVGRTLNRLLDERHLTMANHPEKEGEWFVLPGLVED